MNGRKVPVDLVESIGTSMIHRGPDNFNFLTFENIGVAHNRLSFLDLSPAANQPFKNDDYVLAYNGEIYNFREIRARLERDYNVKFKTTSDTEVLFYSLIHDGIHSCLRHIKGMFAFSFYDRRSNELWLARDHMGIKPLHYIQTGGGFYWSSEIKALVQALGIKPDPVRTLFSIHGIGEKSEDCTLFNDVYQVKPGSYLKVKSNTKEPEFFTYYTPLDDFDPEIYKELDRRPAADVLAEFDSLLNNSIESMLVSDAPLGAFVSGGLDSSLISVIANRKYPDFKMFTANIKGKFSEYEDAKMLADYLGAELFSFDFEPQMILNDWAETTYFYECPIVVHTNAIPFSSVAKLTREHQVKAVLTGEGADELFLGYPRLLTKRYNQAFTLPVTAVKSLYKVAPGLREYLFPDSKSNVADFVRHLVQGFESSRNSQAVEGSFDFLTENKRVDQMLTVKLLGEHLNTLLHRNDRMGMMASIEARFPFLDEDLVKFAINLPVKYKIARAFRWHNYKHPFLIDKWIVRKTAQKYLPKKATMKKKQGFPMMGHKFIRIKEGFFNNGWVSENLSLNRQVQKFLVETQNPYFVAKLASVEVFGRIYACGDSPEKVKNHILKYAEMIT